MRPTKKMSRLPLWLSLVTVLLAAMLTAGAAVVSAGLDSVIAGKVTDQSGAAVTGAVVKALNLASGREVTATTKEDGQYEITGLPPGTYRVTVSLQGFATVAETVTVHEGRPTTQNFSLAPGALEDTLTVTAGKGSARAVEEVPQTVTITTETDIEERRPTSTFQAIERTPNLIQVSANQSVERPRLRGLASSRILIVIDGERLNNVRTDVNATGISPSVVDVTQLESAEVLGSAGSSLYGSDAMAGTINLVTKAPARPTTGQVLGIRFNGDYHTNEALRRYGAAINWSTPHIALRLSGSLFRLDSFHSGGQDIPAAEVLRLGRFATDLANTIVNNAPLSNVARSYAVWSLPAGGKVINSQGHGGNDQIDVWLFPSDNHNLRYRQLNSQHYSLGQSFSSPPYDPLLSRNGFRRLDKYGARYEGREFTRWFSRLAGGFYRQKFSFPQDQTMATILASTAALPSSWVIQNVPNPTPPPATFGLSVLTGLTSVFSLDNVAANHNKNSITSYGADVQATFTPFAGAVVTTGVGYLKDSSHDEFARFQYTPGTGVPRNFVSGATNPDAEYRNVAWFSLLEYDPIRWLHLTGGFRVDNWQTEAKVTPGFPLGTEAAILSASLGGLRANPGAVDLGGLNGAADLAAGKSGLKTDNTIVTGNVGVVVRSPWGINPYFRWANSFREPEVTVRYILRNFGAPTFSVLGVPNTNVKPERGENYDVGVKVKRHRWNASLGYFRNNLADFIRTVFSPILSIPADPARGILPTFGNTHQLQYFQRSNTARARIQGVEATYEVSVPLGRWGSITPFGSMGWLKGVDLTPQANALILINRFYNRSDTLIRLEGSPDDAPLSNITPFRGIFGAHYTDKQGAWFAEYQARHQAQVKRADPIDITSTNVTQYGTFASLSSFTKQSLRFGYNLRREWYRMSFTFGIENLTDRLYFEHFQNSPAPGRSFVFGITTDFFNLLRR